jgi:hypothetical protein
MQVCNRTAVLTDVAWEILRRTRFDCVWSTLEGTPAMATDALHLPGSLSIESRFDHKRLSP